MDVVKPIRKQDPWEKLDEEGARAYEAFQAYLALGPKRSILKAARQVLGQNVATHPGRWSKWSRNHEWVRRAAAWDSAQAREQLRVAEARLEESRKHINRDLPSMALRLLRIAQGEERASMVEFLALKHALNLAGLVEIKAVDVQGLGAGDTGGQVVFYAPDNGRRSGGL